MEEVLVSFELETDLTEIIIENCIGNTSTPTLAKRIENGINARLKQAYCATYSDSSIAVEYLYNDKEVLLIGW